MSQLTQTTGHNRASRQRMLSGKGNPELKSLDPLLRALGLKIALEVD
jgi:DNA-binding phage protein